jgi:hypothetical protein
MTEGSSQEEARRELERNFVCRLPDVSDHRWPSPPVKKEEGEKK